MAITQADRRLIIRMLLNVFGEDADKLARVVRRLRTEFPAVDWAGDIAAVAPTFAPFVASGLSINWWLADIARQAQD